MTLFDIERQRSNGDWYLAGQIDSGTTPEAALNDWLERNNDRVEPGRYRMFCQQFGSRFVDELLVVEERRWVVEKVKDDPEPTETETEVEAKVDLGQRVADVYGEVSR